MKGKVTFAERVGRSVRGNPFVNMRLDGALLLVMVLLCLLVAVGGRSAFVFWGGLALFLAFFVWLGLVAKWGRLKFLRRAGQRRRRAENRRSTGNF